MNGYHGQQQDPMSYSGATRGKHIPIEIYSQILHHVLEDDFRLFFNHFKSEIDDNDDDNNLRDTIYLRRGYVYRTSYRKNITSLAHTSTAFHELVVRILYRHLTTAITHKNTEYDRELVAMVRRDAGGALRGVGTAKKWFRGVENLLRVIEAVKFAGCKVRWPNGESYATSMMRGYMYNVRLYSECFHNGKATGLAPPGDEVRSWVDCEIAQDEGH